jgi:transposase
MSRSSNTIHRVGLSIRAIACATTLDRHTLRHWLNAQTFPERAQRAPVPRKIDPDLPYLKRQWNEGCHHAAALYREIAAEGYTGTTDIVRLVLQSWRHIRPRSPVRFSVPSPRRACTWLLRSKGSPISKFGYPQRFVNRLCRQNPLIGKARRLAQDFIAMLRKQRPIPLTVWIRQAKASGLPELRRFAAPASDMMMKPCVRHFRCPCILVMR